MVYRTVLFREALIVMLLVSAPLIPCQVRADENLWGYLYGTDTLPKGGTEIYNWLTLRLGKGKGTYRGWDEMLELEHGLTDRLQTSFYLKGRSHRIAGGALDDDPRRSLARRDPALILRAGEIRIGAVATSARYFHGRRNSPLPTPLIDGRTRKAQAQNESITVFAPSCMWADASPRCSPSKRREGRRSSDDSLQKRCCSRTRADSFTGVFCPRETRSRNLLRAISNDPTARRQDHRLAPGKN